MFVLTLCVVLSILYCYELIKAILVVQVLRPKGEPTIMFDMLDERTF